MQAGRTRAALASFAAAVVLAAAGAACSSGNSGSSASSSDPCEKIADDAVAAWQTYVSKHGSDIQNVPADATADLQTLQTQIQDLQSQITQNNCKADDIGRRIQEKSPDFLGLDKQGAGSTATTAP